MGCMQIGRALNAAMQLALFAACPATAQRLSNLHTPRNLPAGSTLIIGFLGGFETWDDPHRGVRKVALHLRSLNLSGVYLETIENHHQNLAVKLLQRAGVSTDGHVKVILYGQSWGGAAVIKTAAQLKDAGIPVALTVQLDSVGLHDDAVPSNVRAAANLYQHDHTGIEGRGLIRAQDPSATVILENTRRSYLLRPYNILNSNDTSWARRVLGGSHAKMEADPDLWEHVELLIVRAIQGKV